MVDSARTGPRTLTTSLTSVYVGTVALTAVGAGTGAVWGYIVGQRPVGYSFLMGTNWLTLSLPFFVIREGVLHHRSRLNPVIGRENWMYRDKDEMIASIVAGSSVGAGLAYYTRGPWAVVGGGIVFAGLSGILQSGYTILRHKRQEAGYAHQYPDNDMQQSSNKSNKSLRGILMNRPEREQEKIDDYGYDPVGELGRYIKRQLIGEEQRGKYIEGGLGVAGWISPVVNALDMEYRHRLNVKIEILERQVRELKEKMNK